MNGKRVNQEELGLDELLEDTNAEYHESHFALGKEGKFLRGEYIMEQIGIAERTLYSLAEKGEFSLGRIGNAKVVIAETFYRYLDRNHFKKRTSPDEPPAKYPTVGINEKLTLVGEKHTSVPKLVGIKEFAKDLNIDDRTFTRHCSIGTFYHYRIGSLYKMSREDYDRSLEEAARVHLRSNRGGEKTMGRPSDTHAQLTERLRKERSKQTNKNKKKE